MRKFIPMLIIFSLVLLSLNTATADFFRPIRVDIEQLSYKEEIDLPIDTSIEEAKYQPIDIRYNFKNLCWAKNETIHSVRVYYENNFGLNELESQIYDLNFVDKFYIDSCSIVFIIPEDADGAERYYIFYDEAEIPAPNYYDHLKIQDSHYFYEPVSGAKADLNYFKITEDGIIPYLISYEGTLFGHGVSQVVAKMVPNSKKVETVNLDQFASYTMLYSINDGPDYTGTSFSKDIFKEILIDGNLMVKIRIKSISPERNIKTDNIYTYYYCPTENKKIEVDTNHEVLKDIEIGGSRLTDGTYANLLTFKGRSASIPNLNVGEMLPSLYVYAEDDDIKQITIPADPVSIEDEAILTREDDIDLGKKAWFCIQDPKSGKTHAMVFTSDMGFIQGEDDGLQIKALIEQPIKFPGLEVDVGQVYGTINSYERSGKDNWILFKGLNVSFKSEFLTFEKGGYKAVDKESEIYQKISKIKPSFDKSDSEEIKDIEKYSVDTYVHLAPSFPFGSMLSLLFGYNYSFIYAEIYNEKGDILSSGAVSRAPLNEKLNFDFSDKNLIQRINTLLKLFDWKNFSFFKKIEFSDLEAGKYIIKIYKEHSTKYNQRKYIGYSIVELNENQTTHIFCRPQGSIKIRVTDQSKNPLENIKCLLLENNFEISSSITNPQGNAEILAPSNSLDYYKLQIFYKGFLVKQKQVKIGLLSNILENNEQFIIENYDLTLKLADTWGFTPYVDLSPRIVSEEMVEPEYIYAQKLDKGNFIFSGLYPSRYFLNIDYKSFDIMNEILIKEDNSINLEFPAEYELNIDFFNSYGQKNTDGQIQLKRNNKKEIYNINSQGSNKIIIPPGEYDLTVSYEDETIAKQKVQINADKNLEIVTTNSSVLNSLVILIGFLVILLGFILMIIKKKIQFYISLIIIGLIIISLVSPWWTLQGEKEDISTETYAYLIPSNIVTVTTSPEAIGGEIAQMPSEFSLVLNLIFTLLIISILLIISKILIKDKFKKIHIFLTVAIVGLFLFCLIFFFYTMSIVTELGVGSFIGNGDIETTIPGEVDRELINSSWGPSFGFFAIIVTLAIYLVLSFKKRFFKDL